MNTTATPTNSTVTTTTTPEGQKINTVTLNTPPAPAVSIADRLKAKLNKGAKTQTDKANPITPKALFAELDKPGVIDGFINAALDGNDLAPLVILASHVNRSENLKAAHAAIKYADYAAKHAPTYGLTAPEFIRLLTKLVIEDYNPANMEDETATEAPATAQDTPPATAQDTPPAQTPAQTPATAQDTIPPAPVEKPGETANIFGITDAPPAPAKTSKKGQHKA